MDMPEKPDLFLGGALALLLLEPRKWMHRRVETVSFVDERSLQRRVSVDLTVPGKEVLGPLLFDPVPLPLAFLNSPLLGRPELA